MMWPRQDEASMNAFYGDPDANNDGICDPKWYAENIVEIVPPYTLYYPTEKDGKLNKRGKTLKTLRVHRRCAESLKRILARIARELTPEEIRRFELDICAGVHVFRLKRGGTSLSNHSWGSAIDLSHFINRFGRRYDEQAGMMPLRVVQIFEDEGWRWGGLWTTGDAMHFEAVHNAKRVTAPSSAHPEPINIPSEPEYVPPDVEAEVDQTPMPQPRPARALSEDEIRQVQIRLRELGYYIVGEPDGVFETYTKDAVVLFRRHHGLPHSEEIDDAFLRALSLARPREPNGRTDKTEKDVAPKVEAVQKNAWSRFWAKLIAIPGMIWTAILGAGEHFDAAREKLTPLYEFTSAIPLWAYFGLFTGVAVVIWVQSNRTSAAAVEDYKRGRIQ